MEEKKLIVNRRDLELIHNQLNGLLHPLNSDEIIASANVILSLRKLIEHSPEFKEENEDVTN